MPIFRTTWAIESQIEEFLDAINKGALVFRDAVVSYLEGRTADFCAKLAVLEGLETRADRLSRMVEASLYSQSLIPEHRGDVLALLEHSDAVAGNRWRRSARRREQVELQHGEQPHRHGQSQQRPFVALGHYGCSSPSVESAPAPGGGSAFAACAAACSGAGAGEKPPGAASTRLASI